MNENISRIPKDEEMKKEKEMCDSCIHKNYCIAAYKKNNWCGNHTKRR